jgi:mannose-6-phosphate isomerase-like protein (cupin superfamily)
MRTILLVMLGALAVFGSSGGLATGQGGQGSGPTAQQASAAPTDKASYFPNADVQSTWKDLEARGVINKRVLEGKSHSINVRIVKDGDAPLVHGASADVWLVTAGTATAVTGGQLVDSQKRPNGDDAAGSAIRDGVEQPLQAGDVLYVPSGVPHGFKNVQGFRAFLIRFDTK